MTLLTFSPRALATSGHNGPLAHIWDNAPTQIITAVVALAALGALFTQVEPLAKCAIFLVKISVRPIKRQNSDEEYRIRQRQGFARHVETQLKALSVKEDWRDDRFAELEAEVELEGRERVFRWLRHSPAREVSLRREKSLSKGLARTTDSLVVLEGEPGSGKSVALRHLAERLSRDAQESHSATSLVPLYVNLKEFRPSHRPVDGRKVRDFVFESLTRTNDRDVEQFLEDEFDRGMREGSWLLLLDSFDEIPDVLSSTETDNAVEEYALAINDFLSGMRTSRAIVASREFRGPKSFRVPRFRVMALTSKQQADLIQRSGLKPDDQGIVHEGLAVTDPELQQMAKNPMFLGLVCEYVKSTETFPASSHSAYDSYLERRLIRDADRIRQRYGVGPDLVRVTAEESAFCMTNTEGLGLSPSRAELRSALTTNDRIAMRLLDKALDALEYTKLGRAAEDPAGSGQLHFTFAHRRFQEYFATRVVLREPGRVPARDLLINGRWRETAVTILQTQPPVARAPLLDEAALQLVSIVESATNEANEMRSANFSWPPNCLHILHLLDAGLGRAPESIPNATRNGIGRLLRIAWTRGRRHDRKWATSVALTADRETTIWLLKEAFGSGSAYLGGAAYTGVSRIANPPDSLYSGVRQTLRDLAANRQLMAERITIRAQISRLPEPSPLLRVLRLLTTASAIDLILGILITAASTYLFWPTIFVGLILIPITLYAFPITISRSDFNEASMKQQSVIPVPIIAQAAYIGRLAPTYALLLFANSYTFGHKLTIGICAIVASIYFGLWPLVVLDACKNERSPGIFTVLGGPLLLGIHARHRIVKIANTPLAYLKEIAWWHVALIVVISSLATGLAIFMYENRPSHRTIAIVVIIIFVAIIAFPAINALRLMPIVIKSYRNWINDRHICRDLQSTDRNLNSTVLLQALSRIRSAAGTARIVTIALRADFTNSPTLLKTLSDLAAVIESRAADAFPTSLDVATAQWIQTYPEQVILLTGRMPDAILDAIARAVEQVELARQGATTES